MKAKLFLLFILSGFVWLDWSCDDRPDWTCKDQIYDIIGVKSIQIEEINSEGEFVLLNSDSVTYDSVCFEISFEEKLLSSTIDCSIFNKAFATQPCPPPYSIRELDSIKIFVLINNTEIDISENFSLIGLGPGTSDKIKLKNEDTIFQKELSYISRNAYRKMIFYIETVPVIGELAQYKFQFFDKQKRIHSIISDPIVITP